MNTAVSTPGWKTSEFRVAAVTSAVTLLNMAFHWHIYPTTILQIIGIAATYIASRGIAKSGTVSGP